MPGKQCGCDLDTKDLLAELKSRREKAYEARDRFYAEHWPRKRLLKNLRDFAPLLYLMFIVFLLIFFWAEFTAYTEAHSNKVGLDMLYFCVIPVLSWIFGFGWWMRRKADRLEKQFHAEYPDAELLEDDPL